jgi:hypothetical protein
MIAASGIYPPWKGIERTGRYSPVSEYGWIFSPPVLPWFLAQIDTLENLKNPEISKYLDPADWSWEVEVPRLLVQWMTIMLVGSGIVLLLKSA